MSHASRAAQLQDLLDAEVIDMEKLAKLCLNGIPDHPRSLRPSCWKVLLGYESINGAERPVILRKLRRQYYDYINELLVDPFIEASNDATLQKTDRNLGKKGKTQTKHMTQVQIDPLCDDPKYKQYYNDNLTLYDIDKDVRRTRANLAFFQQEVQISHLSPLTPHMSHRFSIDSDRDPIVEAAAASARSGDNLQDVAIGQNVKTRRTIFARLRHLNRDRPSSESSSRLPMEPGKIMAARTSIDENEVHDRHWECVERILFVFAKLNPSISYTQGMSELLAPIYFVLAHDTFSKFAEADTFGCFTAFMSDFRDLYESTHDDDQAGSGISAVLSRFMIRLQVIDAELHQNMVEKGIEPAYFAFRWFSLALAQDFDLPDVIRIWDSLLASRLLQNPEGSDYLTDFCCAMLNKVRDEIISQPFAENIKLLQNYPPIDIADILSLTLDFHSRENSAMYSGGLLDPLSSDGKARALTFLQHIQQSAAHSLDHKFVVPTKASFSTFSLPSTKDETREFGNEDSPCTSVYGGEESIRPAENSLQVQGQSVYHSPKASDRQPDRWSFGIKGPKLPSITLSSTKHWFDAVAEEPDTEQAHMSVNTDSTLGVIRDKSASLFRKAGAFISNTQQAHKFQNTRDAEAALHDDRFFGRPAGGFRGGRAS